MDGKEDKTEGPEVDLDDVHSIKRYSWRSWKERWHRRRRKKTRKKQKKTGDNSGSKEENTEEEKAGNSDGKEGEDSGPKDTETEPLEEKQKSRDARDVIRPPETERGQIKARE